MRIVVTGASGFIGRHLCRELQQHGHEPIALVRPSATELPCERVVARDLADRPALRRALAGAQAVVHLAGRAHVTQERDTPEVAAAYHTTNVDGTIAVVEESIAAAIDTFVFVSTIKVMGSRSTAPFTEAMPPTPDDLHGATKLMAEDVVCRIGDGHAMRTVVLRPPLVYGPGMRANMLRLFHAVARGEPLPFGGIDNRRSLIGVRNLTHAIRTTLDCERATGRYFVCDSTAPSTPELIAAIGAALGARPRMVHLPRSALTVLARVGDVVNHLVPFPFSTAQATRLLSSLEADGSLFGKTTGFVPRVDLAHGLAETAVWYRATHCQ